MRKVGRAGGAMKRRVERGGRGGKTAVKKRSRRRPCLTGRHNRHEACPSKQVQSSEDGLKHFRVLVSRVCKGSGGSHMEA